MKLLAKLGLFGLVVGAGATALYAAPDLSSPESLTEIQVRAQAIHGAALDDLRHTDHLQTIARKEKDVIKLNCVNDKLVQIKPQINLIEKSQLALVGPTGAAS